jgi:hypothetical protein
MTLIIKKIGETKRGAFTNRPIDANDVVLKFPGDTLSAKQVSELSAEQQGNVLQIGQDRYLNLEKETPFFINHHCNPNCYVKTIVGGAFLIALRPIAKDEEITFDYSLTSTDSKEEWSMPCSCHKYYCRKIISGFRTLPADKQEEFEKTGTLPRYINR